MYIPAIYIQTTYQHCWQIADKICLRNPTAVFGFFEVCGIFKNKYQVLGQHSLQLFLLWQNCNAIVPSATPGRCGEKIVQGRKSEATKKVMTITTNNSENHLKSWLISTQKWSHVSYSLWIQSPYQRMIGVYNHLLSQVFRFHYHSQKVIGSQAITLQEINISHLGKRKIIDSKCHFGGIC